MLISGYRPGACDALAAMNERVTTRDRDPIGLSPRKLLPGDVVGDAEILAERDPAKPAHARVWANSGRCPSRIVGQGRKLTCRPDRP